MAEVEEGQEKSTVKRETKEAEVENQVVEEEEHGPTESQIQRAMRSRVPHFKQLADSLTFEGVQRLLEEDLGLERYALDVHKRFIKQCLLECLNGGDGENGSKSLAETVENNFDTGKGEVAESLEKEQLKEDVGVHSSENEEKMEDSPVMGLLTGNKKTKVQTKEIQGGEKKEVPTESTIKGAIKKRASYLKANSDVMMAGFRRLLEEDLEVDKDILFPFKKFITEQVDKVIKSPKVSEPASVKKEASAKKSDSKPSKKIYSEGSSDSLNSESEEIEDERKSKKKVAPKKKIPKSEEPMMRKRPVKETKESSKKRSKLAEASEKNSDAEAGRNASEGDQSQSSGEKPAKEIHHFFTSIVYIVLVAI